MPNSRFEMARELFQNAYQLQMQGDFELAAQFYKRSIELHPTAEAHTFLGWTYHFQGKLDEAIAECKKAIAVDPTFGNPYNDIGAYRIERGEHEQVCADVVVRISKRRIHGDRLLTLGNGLV